ncbi:hypothetical protein Hanom_Chr05g00446921 [Helianthus anomalus]
MALVTILEGVESEEVVSNSEEVCDNIKTNILEGKVGEEMVNPLTDPWDSSVCEGECVCAMMAAAKVSPQVLKDLCSDKCVIAFANFKNVIPREKA